MWDSRANLSGRTGADKPSSWPGSVRGSQAREEPLVGSRSGRSQGQPWGSPRSGDGERGFVCRRSCLERGWCSWSTGRGCSGHGGAEGEGLAPALEQRELLWAPCLAHGGLGRALAPLSLLRCSRLLSAENQGSWVILKSTVTLWPFMADQPRYHECYHPQSPSKPIPTLFPNRKLQQNCDQQLGCAGGGLEVSV